MAGGHIDLTGYEDIMETLAKLSDFPHYGNTLLRRAVEWGAQIVKDEIQRRAVRSTANREHLADNALVKTTHISKDGSIRGRVGFKRDFAYQNALEVGHIVRTKDRGYAFVEARPSVGPAWAAKQDDAMDEIAHVIREGLPEVIAKVARRRAKEARRSK